MKRRNKNLFFLLLLTSVAYGQLKHPGYFEDYHVPTINQPVQMNSNSTSLSSLFSPNGQAFTPKGDMKVLIICAGFGTPYDNYSMSGWTTGTNSLPDWAISNSTFYTNDIQFSNPATNNDKNNVSRFYFEMSKGSFKLTADVYPNRVNINPTGATGWSQLNRKVIEKMKEDDPNFDWSKYDKRTNNPNFQFDNCNSVPDMMPDFVIIVYRYQKEVQNVSSPWYINPPISNMANWSGSGGGYAALNGLSGLNYNDYSFDYYGGYTHCLGTASTYDLFIHEVSHNIFSFQHYAGNNGTMGKYFYYEIGPWGFMNLTPINCANAWERWYLGWIDIKANGANSDIKNELDLPVNGEFILRDFITSGDVVRIKVPNGTGRKQYIWLENHVGTSIYDNSVWSSSNGCVENALPSAARGLIALIESINDDRNNPTTSLSNELTNAIKQIHSKGNHDYSFALQNTTPSCLLWGNSIKNMIEGDANSLSGQSRSSGIRLDYNNNGVIPVNEYWNGVDVSLREYHWVAMRDGIMTYDFLEPDMNFPVGQKLGMATNPAFVNRPIYNLNSKQMSPFYLNGISVSVLSQEANGNIKVKIVYNDVTINSDIRWTGNIVLPDITNSTDPDLIVSSNQTLTINKSGTPNCHIKNTFNDFVNPTVFTSAQNSLFKMQSFSNTIDDNLSTFILVIGSTLDINAGAVFTVQNGSTLQIKSGANLNLFGSGKIVVKSGGYICVESGASINLQDYNSLIVLEEGALLGANPLLFTSPTCANSIAKNGNGSIVDYSQDIYIQNQTISTNRYIGGKNIYVGNHVINSQTIGDVLITNGANVIFDCKEVIFDAGFECTSGSTYEVINHQ